MKKLALLLLLGIAVGGSLLLAGGIYHTNSGTLVVVIDTGAASTVDTQSIKTPIQAYQVTGYTAKLKMGTPITAMGTRWTHSDSIKMVLYTSLGDGQKRLLDSATRVPPCSLFTEVMPAKILNDTTFARTKSLLKDIYFDVVFTDSTSIPSGATADSMHYVNQPYYYEIIVKE